MSLLQKFGKHVAGFLQSLTSKEAEKPKPVTREHFRLLRHHKLPETRLLRPDSEPSEPHSFELRTNDHITLIEERVRYVVVELRRSLNEAQTQKATLLLPILSWELFLSFHYSAVDEHEAEARAAAEANDLVDKFTRKKPSTDDK